MSRILLITSDPGVQQRFNEVVAQALDVLPSSVLGDPATVSQALANRPSILIVDATQDPEGALSLADWTREYHRIPVILVGDQNDAWLAVRALRAGVVDVVDAAAPARDFRAAVERVPVQQPLNGQQAQRQTGRVVTVASPKGGVGKTTVASNLAIGIAQQAHENTVIVDLDIHFGDVASALNLEPEYSLPDTTKAAAAGDALALKTFLTRHESGLFVVPGSDSPAAADAVSAEDIHNLLKLLAESFAYVVVDTSPGLTEHTLAALDATDHQVLVSSLDVPGIRGLRKEMETLTELGMLLPNRQVVINFADPARGLSLEDVEATLGSKINLAIPPTKLIPISVNQGVPLLHSHGTDKVTKSLRALVHSITGPPAEPQRSRGLFGARR
ncbi:AAA family ATPase [Tessaracoccus sp. OS52]|uniref:AAA family ATPase n=1 Tax=Tessaracoccus sp. OS52 TaxID=2886691 RepID=UPI001D0FC82F|nr:AAA family ATPase [Tessaracoccus sp. OS52]MCC2594134.1 AAA family ATPase [Tessaracoccus sp. OS52]